MKDYNLINQRATTCRHGGHCEWVACDKCNHYEPDVLNQQPCEDAVSRDCDKCVYYDDGANHEACDECFADEYEHPNFKPKTQHCDDCISRQAVLNGLASIAKVKARSDAQKSLMGRIMFFVEQLPPVTPKEKTGRWISLGIQGEIDGQIVRAFTCSKCGAISIFRVSNGNIVNGDLCPNCGAKMQEVENE